MLARVSHSFLREQGIYHVLQPSIGQDMILAAEDRLISYREFCELLLTPARRVWLDRLIAFYLETGHCAVTRSRRKALEDDQNTRPADYERLIQRVMELVAACR